MGRLVVVSNRVPSLSEAAAGGLAVGLKAALEESGGLWFGWSGRLSDDSRPGISEVDSFRLATIDIPQEDFEAYYNGCANRTLWPLLHGRLDLAHFETGDYPAYRRVNALFADSLLPLLEPDDTVWIHDYHLIPLGRELRRRGLRAPLGFFLHTPFPGPDIISALPWQHDLADDLAAYTLVGFQTHRDCRNFRDFIERDIGGSVSADGQARADGHRFQIGAFPISIDVDRFSSLAASPETRRLLGRLQACVDPWHGVIGVDRLDYSKGLPERFTAFGAFLEAFPQYQGKASLTQIAVPSRESVPEYMRLKQELEAMVGRINGRYAELDWLPIRYLNTSFSQGRLAALYRCNRVGLVTPLRDGMNLVAKEYVAAQNPQDPGVLILSRFAGAAEELDSALTVNPYDVDGVSRALDAAFAMSLSERRARWQAMMGVLRRNDIADWRRNFLASLAGAHGPVGSRQRVAA